MEDPERFDAAIRAIIDGDEETLRSILAEDHEIVTRKSSAPHGATLLHYIAANGVEDEFQKSAANAPAIARILLEGGAAVDAYLEVRGRKATTLEMLVSSWPPFERGVQEQLVRILVQGGASVDGPDSDGRPLNTALVFGYTRSAEALAELGARKDNLFVAAGLGDISKVRDWFDGNGDLRDGSLSGYVAIKRGPPHLEPVAIVQEAFHFAVTHGREESATFLMRCGADPNGRVVGHHCELPLVQALFLHNLATARWLIANGANPELRDPKRGMSAIEHVQRFGPQGARELVGLQ